VAPYQLVGDHKAADESVADSTVPAVFAASVLKATLNSCHAIVERHKDSAAFPELFKPLLEAAESMDSTLNIIDEINRTAALAADELQASKKGKKGQSKKRPRPTLKSGPMHCDLLAQRDTLVQSIRQGMERNVRRKPLALQRVTTQDTMIKSLAPRVDEVASLSISPSRRRRCDGALSQLVSFRRRTCQAR
jgi:hypothetical protein